MGGIEGKILGRGENKKETEEKKEDQLAMKGEEGVGEISRKGGSEIPVEVRRKENVYRILTENNLPNKECLMEIDVTWSNQENARAGLKELDQNVLPGGSIGRGVGKCANGGTWKRKDRKTQVLSNGNGQEQKENVLTIGIKRTISKRKKRRIK